VRRPPFTIEQLRSFVAVANGEHVSRAAASLFLTQAAVTQQIRHLEQGLGLQLLERDGRRVRLTDAGRSLAEVCQTALRAIEVVDESALAMKELRGGSLHVGASPTCATYYLPPHLAEFTRRHPKVKLTVAVDPSADLNRAVASGALDCALIEGAANPDLWCFELTRDELVMVVHRDHPLARLKRVAPADLAKHRYLGRGPQWSAEQTVRKMLGNAYDHVEVLNLGHPEYVRAATVAGLGFAALPKRAVANDVAAGLLARLPVAPVLRPITAVRRHSRSGPSLEAFWTLLTGNEQPPSGRISRDGNQPG
jgi:DNA-binding transcriptional LysR family regulator